MFILCIINFGYVYAFFSLYYSRSNFYLSYNIYIISSVYFIVVLSFFLYLCVELNRVWCVFEIHYFSRDLNRKELTSL